MVIDGCIPPRGRIKGTAWAIYSILPQLLGNMEYIAALGQYGIYCPGPRYIARVQILSEGTDNICVKGKKPKKFLTWYSVDNVVEK